MNKVLICLTLFSWFSLELMGADSLESKHEQAEAFICNVCSGPAFQKCARCLKTSYCGRAHQRADWKVHKEVCKEHVLFRYEKLIQEYPDIHLYGLSTDFQLSKGFDSRVIEVLQLLKGKKRIAYNVFTKSIHERYPGLKGWIHTVDDVAWNKVVELAMQDKRITVEQYTSYENHEVFLMYYEEASKEAKYFAVNRRSSLSTLANYYEPVILEGLLLRYKKESIKDYFLKTFTGRCKDIQIEFNSNYKRARNFYERILVGDEILWDMSNG